MGCYLEPYNALTIENVMVAISQRPQGGALLVAGDFNTNLSAPKRWTRDEEIAVAMDTAGLENMSENFLPRKKLWLKESRTWCIHRGGWEVRSQTNYIMGTDCRLLQNVAVWGTRHNTDN